MSSHFSWLVLASMTTVLASVSGLETTKGLWGEMARATDEDNLITIMSCFHGLGMKTCKLDGTISHNSDDLVGVFPDFAGDQIFSGVDSYCLECCSNRRLTSRFEETLVLKCDLTSPRETVDGRSRTFDGIKMVDWEFRFARRETITDDTVIRCPLVRIDTEAYIVGYELKLWVQEHNRMIDYWRGVTKCEAVAIESNDLSILASQIFTEQITLLVGQGRRLVPSAILSFLLISFPLLFALR